MVYTQCKKWLDKYTGELQHSSQAKLFLNKMSYPLLPEGCADLDPNDQNFVGQSWISDPN